MAMRQWVVSEQAIPERFHPIGTPGQPWTDADKAAWRQQQSIRRSYADEVRAKLEGLDPCFVVEQYGALPIDPERYPLFAVRPAEPLADAPWVLVTGGVHGYETSGVQGALAFLHGPARAYAERINLLVAPCVSPWGYEVKNRWNPEAIDPNRSFVRSSPAQECAALMALIADLRGRFLVHVDLHETTDSDESEFRPALAARDGKAFVPGHIPDGFYTVGDTDNPQEAFQAAIIHGVQAVTHIAEADDKGEIIGSKVVQRGVILYPFVELGLCAGVTGARFTSTTEVYPDSPRATPELCNAAQVAAVCAALDHVLASS
ncbi:M14 family metallopeptidase [Paraliomyxa miuraensis]|uniref:M14 family metallopeptidase n=1 Tax=Paraliomyxa miuraensis TaxID=376150 RepID=UPI0022512517|nr:M14 family metallocarboxypeptidase [Paraliomyxa miuraensis]MCX4243587.1 M14 family metallocarboxypeptidase [Paraliomyxa miuraensis]